MDTLVLKYSLSSTHSYADDVRRPGGCIVPIPASNRRGFVRSVCIRLALARSLSGQAWRCLRNIAMGGMAAGRGGVLTSSRVQCPRADGSSQRQFPNETLPRSHTPVCICSATSGGLASLTSHFIRGRNHAYVRSNGRSCRRRHHIRSRKADASDSYVFTLRHHHMDPSRVCSAYSGTPYPSFPGFSQGDSPVVNGGPGPVVSSSDPFEDGDNLFEPLSNNDDDGDVASLFDGTLSPPIPRLRPGRGGGRGGGQNDTTAPNTPSNDTTPADESTPANGTTPDPGTGTGGDSSAPAPEG